MQNPTLYHLGAVKRVLHYISGTMGSGLLYECVSEPSLQASQIATGMARLMIGKVLLDGCLTSIRQ